MGCCTSKGGTVQDSSIEDQYGPAGSTKRQNVAGGPLDYDPVESTSAVKVAVVVRPLIDLEKQKKAQEVTEVVPPASVRVPPLQIAGSVTPSEPQNFNFDRAYRLITKEDSRRLFAELVLPLLDRFLQGFNATVFAYGQTGSGKTYTMGTAASVKEVSGKQEPMGVIPRAVKAVFAALQQKADYDTEIKCDFVEIYQDELRDLLVNTSEDGQAAPGISVRESPDKGLYLEGIREVNVKTEADIAQLLEQGNNHRAVASHNLNEASSRSHAIFTISLEQRCKPSAAAVGKKSQFLRSKLHLVDLAGSERAKDTGASGQQMAEGININKGLLALGNVISALTEGKGRKHIPYRDSKLTRILQDSLGGSSETLMIACVSPAHYNADQTISTLRYASRARNIKNNLKLNNKMSAEDEVKYLRTVLAQRDAELAELRRQLEGKAGSSASASAKSGTNKVTPTRPTPRRISK